MPVEISEKEFAVIREISNNHLPDQRTIASKTGLSLGLTNLIIKKLIKTGYIKVKQLNKKKIQYILTPKGFAEKAKKSYNYVLKTAKKFLSINQKLRDLILQEYQNGKREFFLIVDEEFYKILEFVFKSIDLKDIEYKRISSIPKNIKNKNSIYLITSEEIIQNKSENIINLLSYLE